MSEFSGFEYKIEYEQEEEEYHYDTAFTSSIQQLQLDASKEVCALQGKIQNQCDGQICQLPKKPSIIPETDSPKSIQKPQHRKKVKKPLMKSGWMMLENAIPDFAITDEIFDELSFRENLLVSVFSESRRLPVPVGGLSLDVRQARGGPVKYQKDKTKSDFVCPKFLVHLSSQLDCSGANGSSSIISWVDRDLQTLEENRKEFIQRDEGKEEQTLYINSQSAFYYLRYNKTKDIVHSPNTAKNLICEGSNFILMRYLALTRFIGTFETTTLYINGDLCRNIYECRGPKGKIVNNTKLDVCKIYRTIIEKCGIEHRIVTLLTLQGQILSQEWQSLDYILQVNPLEKLCNQKPSGYGRKFLEESWEKDLQLLSLYLDAKTVNKKVIENYVRDDPGIQHLMADYAQTILQLKPDDVFEFTSTYFLNFSPKLIPFSEYFEAHETVKSGEDEDDLWRYI